MEEVSKNTRMEEKGKETDISNNGSVAKQILKYTLIAGCFFVVGTLFGSSTKDGSSNPSNLTFLEDEENYYNTLPHATTDEITAVVDATLPFASNDQDFTIEDILEIFTHDMEKKEDFELNKLIEDAIVDYENNGPLIEEIINTAPNDLMFLNDDENNNNNVTDDEGYRKLSSSTVQWLNHRSLSCNDNIEVQSCANNKLSDLLDNANVGSDTLVIPCGVCIEVDTTDGSILELPEGLRIDGKLYFPSSSNIVIRTTFIFVMGVLKIDTPTASNQVKFSLYGEDEVYIVPGDDSSNVGSKVIAVHGGKLDIVGYDTQCPSWEKLEALGSPIVRPYDMPCDDDGNCIDDITLHGNACAESPGHSLAYGKYTIWCLIEPTVLVHHNEALDLTFRILAPLPLNFEPPTDITDGTPLELSFTGPCREYKSYLFNKCTIMCNVARTTTITTGESKGLRLTSRIPNREFSLPTGVELRRSSARSRGARSCTYDAHQSRVLNSFTVKCYLERTVPNTVQFRGVPLKLMNVETGNYMNATNGIAYLSLAGYKLYFHPDNEVDTGNITEVNAFIDEVNEVFPPGSEISVDYHYPHDGRTVRIDGVHQWSSNGRFFMFPTGYDIDQDQCDQAAVDINEKIPANWDIDIEYDTELPVDPGYEMVSNGVSSWTSLHGSGKHMMFFHPEEGVSLHDFNDNIRSGYRIQVSYVDAYNQLKVSPEAGECWGRPGTELVISSSTRRNQDRILATVTGYDASTGMISVAETLLRPIITLEDHSEFAAEIASLNRPVIFEAESDEDDEFIGGHLIIQYTNRQQRIEGVEIRNFGQQGRLGRYPLHFHHCGDSIGSMVVRNVVRQSNQRGYVMHNTNQVTLEENVAFDITGHCFFNEDGTEVDNTFRNNLVIQVKKMPVDKKTQLEELSGRSESDDKCSGFWISNANNTYIGNVVAGSEHHGYWFETFGVQASSNLIAFEDNEVHSTKSWAFTVYKPGWKPSEINIIKNFKAYRNENIGAFLHNSRNLYFEDGIFADNGDRDVRVNLADSYTFDGTIFIGNTGLAPPLCHQSRLAIELSPTRSYNRDESGEYRGTTLINTKFYNWTQSDTGCEQDSKPIRFDDFQLNILANNAAHRFENIESDISLDLDFSLIDEYMDDVIIEVSSDDHETITPSGLPGFLASEKVTTFLPPDTCAVLNEYLHFCPQVCLRTISFITGDSAMPEDVVLLAKDSLSGREIEIERDVMYNDRGSAFNHAIFTAALPKVPTEVRFEKKSQPGTVVWPGFVMPVFESSPSCANHIIRSDLTFEHPTTTDNNADRCDSLIYNGNFDHNLDGWESRFTGNVWSETEGIDGSGALKTTTRTSPEGHWAQQYLDMTCIQQDDVYRVEASFRLLDASNNTMQTACQGGRGSSDCPRADIGHASVNVPDGWARIVSTDLEYNNDLDSTVFNLYEGTWTVSEAEADAERITFTIKGGEGNYILDNVSVTKIPNSSNRRYLRENRKK